MLEAGANAVIRIASAMRFDSDDELGYPGIDLDGRGGPMLGLVGKRGGRHGEDHGNARVGRHADNKGAQAAALGAHAIVDDRARTARRVLVNRRTADVVGRPAVIRPMAVVVMPGGQLLSDDGWCRRVMRGVTLPRRHATRGKCDRQQQNQ